MTEGLFLIDKGNVPKRMEPRAFDTEADFQSLITKFPELLTHADFGEGSRRRARREVVAQMLDYAANAMKWWDAKRIRERLDERCKDEAGDSAELLDKARRVDVPRQDEFWQWVKAAPPMERDDKWDTLRDILADVVRQIAVPALAAQSS